MRDNGLTDTFFNRVMPWVAILVALSTLAVAIAHWSGASDNTVALVFLAVAAPGSACLIVLAVIVGRRLGKQRRG